MKLLYEKYDKLQIQIFSHLWKIKLFSVVMLLFVHNWIFNFHFTAKRTRVRCFMQYDNHIFTIFGPHTDKYRTRIQ